MYTSSLLTHDYAVGHRKDGEYKKMSARGEKWGKKEESSIWPFKLFVSPSFHFSFLSSIFYVYTFFCASFIPVDISNVFSIFLSFSRTYTYILFFYLLPSSFHHRRHHHLVHTGCKKNKKRKEKEKICGIWRSWKWTVTKWIRIRRDGKKNAMVR